MANWTKPLEQKRDATAGQSRTRRGARLLTVALLVLYAVAMLVVLYPLAPVLVIGACVAWLLLAIGEVAR